MLWSNVISVGKAGSKVIGETVGFQVAGDNDIEMAGPEVSSDADVPARVEDSGVSIEMTAKALPALISVVGARFGPSAAPVVIAAATATCWLHRVRRRKQKAAVVAISAKLSPCRLLVRLLPKVVSGDELTTTLLCAGRPWRRHCMALVIASRQ